MSIVREIKRLISESRTISYIQSHPEKRDFVIGLMVSRRLTERIRIYDYYRSILDDKSYQRETIKKLLNILELELENSELLDEKGIDAPSKTTILEPIIVEKPIIDKKSLIERLNLESALKEKEQVLDMVQDSSDLERLVFEQQRLEYQTRLQQFESILKQQMELIDCLKVEKEEKEKMANIANHELEILRHDFKNKLEAQSKQIEEISNSPDLRNARKIVSPMVSPRHVEATPTILKAIKEKKKGEIPKWK